MCQEARETETKPGNGGTEILKKPLDKRHKMCYNEYVKRGTHRDTPLRIGGNGNTCELTPKTPNNNLPCDGKGADERVR